MSQFVSRVWVTLGVSSDNVPVSDRHSMSASPIYILGVRIAWQRQLVYSCTFRLCHVYEDSIEAFFGNRVAADDATVDSLEELDNLSSCARSTSTVYIASWRDFKCL